MRSEGPSGKHAKLHTVSASNNGDHTPCALNYCLLAEVAMDPECRSRLRQDSAFFFRIRTRSQNFVKNRIRSQCSLSAVAGVCVVIMKWKHGYISVGSLVTGAWTGLWFLNMMTFQTQIQNFWNRSGVGSWKSDSGHLCLSAPHTQVLLLAHIPFVVHRAYIAAPT